jgi:hypothetical protein
VKKALARGENPLSVTEVDFVQTCCRILFINSEEKIDEIGRRALEDGKGKVRKVMSAIMMLLVELGDKVKGHQRNSPGPSLSTQSYDDMDAPELDLETAWKISGSPWRGLGRQVGGTRPPSTIRWRRGRPCVET